MNRTTLIKRSAFLLPCLVVGFGASLELEFVKDNLWLFLSAYQYTPQVLTGTLILSIFIFISNSVAGIGKKVV